MVSYPMLIQGKLVRLHTAPLTFFLSFGPHTRGLASPTNPKCNGVSMLIRFNPSTNFCGSFLCKLSMLLESQTVYRTYK